MVGQNLIAYGRSIDTQGYIVDCIPAIKEYMDKKDLDHFSVKTKKSLGSRLSLTPRSTNKKIHYCKISSLCWSNATLSWKSSRTQ
jgi:hypothetical protein